MNLKLFDLHPDWVSGFTQADGCFNISFRRTKNSKKVKFLPRGRFIISQHIKDEQLILSIKNFFKCGIIIKNKKEIHFVVNSIDELLSIIIPHFIKYPLKSGKYISFKYFEKIIILMKEKKHLTEKGLIEIVKLAYNMNPLGIRKISKEELLYNLNLKQNDLNQNNLNLDIQKITSKSINLWFIGGLIQGDGCFNISFKKTGICYLRLIIVQDIYSKNLLYELLKFFTVGNVIDCKVNMFKYTVLKIEDLNKKVLPILSNEPNLLFLDKQKQFEIFKKINSLMINKKHLTKEEKLNIIELAYNMNWYGGKRKLTKEEFISKINMKI